MSLDYPTGNFSKVQRALVVSAHLKLYWGYGCEYLFSHSCEAIKRWVSVEDVDCVPPIVYLEPLPDGNMKYDNMVIATQHGSGNGMIVVPIIQPVPDRAWLSVLLPGPTRDSYDAYQEIVQSVAESGNARNTKAKHFPLIGPKKLQDPAYKGAFHVFWSQAVKAWQ